MNQIIPLYTWYNDLPTWEARIATVQQNDLVVLDPNNGPPPPDQVSVIKDHIYQIRKRGGYVYGYVDTMYGDRRIEDVLENVTAWARIGVDRIFFDQWKGTVRSTQYRIWLLTGALQQNMQMTNKNPAYGPVAIFNPGVACDYENVPARCLVVTYEGLRSDFPKKKWKSWEAALCYGGSEPVVGPEFSYVTNDNLPNPWDGIVSWSDPGAQWGNI